MKESLQQLPQSLSQLVGQGLDRLCSQYRAMGGLRLALGALALSDSGKTRLTHPGDYFSRVNLVQPVSTLSTLSVPFAPKNSYCTFQSIYFFKFNFIHAVCFALLLHYSEE